MKGIQMGTVQNHCRVPPSPVSNKLTPCKRAEVYVNEPLRHTRILFRECSLEFFLLLKGNNTFTDTNFFWLNTLNCLQKLLLATDVLNWMATSAPVLFYGQSQSGLGSISVCPLYSPGSNLISPKFASTMATSKRYIPPGARQKDAAGGPRKNSEDPQRSLDDLVKGLGSGVVYTVQLRSEKYLGKYKVCILIN